MMRYYDSKRFRPGASSRLCTAADSESNRSRCRKIPVETRATQFREKRPRRPKNRASKRTSTACRSARDGERLRVVQRALGLAAWRQTYFRFRLVRTKEQATVRAERPRAADPEWNLCGALTWRNRWRRRRLHAVGFHLSHNRIRKQPGIVPITLEWSVFNGHGRCRSVSDSPARCDGR